MASRLRSECPSGLHKKLFGDYPVFVDQPRLEGFICDQFPLSGFPCPGHLVVLYIYSFWYEYVIFYKKNIYANIIGLNLNEVLLLLLLLFEWEPQQSVIYPKASGIIRKSIPHFITLLSTVLVFLEPFFQVMMLFTQRQERLFINPLEQSFQLFWYLLHLSFKL